MKRIWFIGVIVPLLFAACEKSPALPNNPETLVQGEWQFERFVEKSWKGRIRIGGQRLRVKELSLHIDSADYMKVDDTGDAVESGGYSVREDSIIFFDGNPNPDNPTRFKIEKLTASEMVLLVAESPNTFLGEVYTEARFSYQR